MNIVDKLKHTISKPEAKAYIDKLGIELVVDTSEVNKELDRVNRLMQELGSLGVKLHDVAQAKMPNDKSLPLIGECERGLLLVNSNGEPFYGQRDVKITSPHDDVCTATVTFIVGGIYKGVV